MAAQPVSAKSRKAATRIEDAAALSRVLSQPAVDISAALRGYEELRRPHRRHPEAFLAERHHVHSPGREARDERFAAVTSHKR